jgi:hypothetical protein
MNSSQSHSQRNIENYRWGNFLTIDLHPFLSQSNAVSSTENWVQQNQKPCRYLKKSPTVLSRRPWALNVQNQIKKSTFHTWTWNKSILLRKKTVIRRIEANEPFKKNLLHNLRNQWYKRDRSVVIWVRTNVRLENRCNPKFLVFVIKVHSS